MTQTRRTLVYSPTIVCFNFNQLRSRVHYGSVFRRHWHGSSRLSQGLVNSLQENKNIPCGLQATCHILKVQTGPWTHRRSPVVRLGSARHGSVGSVPVVRDVERLGRLDLLWLPYDYWAETTPPIHLFYFSFHNGVFLVLYSKCL